MAIESVDDVPFSFHETGENSEKTWNGDFRAKKRLSFRDHLRKDQVRRELLGSMGGGSTERALSIAMVLSELAVRLTKVPEWWVEKGNGIDLEDDNIIGLLYDECVKIENAAKQEKLDRAEKAQAKMRADVETKVKAEADAAAGK